MAGPASRSVRVALTLLCVAMAAPACTRGAADLFFDLPQAATHPASPRAVPAAPDTAGMTREPARPLPPIEATLDIDSAMALLPRDHAGNVDFAEAARRAVIRPRSVLPGQPEPRDSGFQFKFDFFYPGPDTLFDAWFPHSTHTQWVDCRQCHGRIFKYRGTPVKMADVFTGKYCGECHGKVSFSPMTACERCHVKLAMPANRAKPEFIGTLTIPRASGDSALAGTIEGNAAGVNTASFPNARFPHWVHRVRYTCKACHVDTFEPKLGANRITMKAIGEGRFCGKCHDGVTAFQATLDTCQRCHVPVEQPKPGG